MKYFYNGEYSKDGVEEEFDKWYGKVENSLGS